MLQANPDLTARQLRDLILLSANKRCIDNYLVLNAARAVEFARSPSAATIPQCPASVAAVSCTRPVVGELMTCTLTGSHLPADTRFTATNCSPDPMHAVPGGTGSSRSFTCTPLSPDVPVAVSYTLPSHTGVLPTVPVMPATAQPATTDIFAWPVDPTNRSRGRQAACADQNQGCYWLHDTSPNAATVWRDAQPFQQEANTLIRPGETRWHLGADYNLGSGNDDHRRLVHAAADGVVSDILLNQCGFGNVMFLRHRTSAGPVVTMYAHVDWLDIQRPVVGARVARGEVIAQIGDGAWTASATCASSGSYWSTGTHLHFEVRLSDDLRVGSAYTPTQLAAGTLGPQGQTDPNAFIRARMEGAASGSRGQSIAAGDGHTCALTASGGVRCWGYNLFNQLGDGTGTDRPTPVNVVGLSSGGVAVAAGAGHTCALTSAGGVKCWGGNLNGQLGDGTTTVRPTPVDVVGLSSGVVAVVAGMGHTCALTSAGGVKCWGSDGVIQFGDGMTFAQRTTPVDMVGLSSGVVAVAAGWSHTCALTIAGGVKCWGDNLVGQLGDGTRTARPTPVDVVGLSSGVVAIAGGRHHTCALTSAGGVKCWGWNGSGQLGDGTTTARPTPTDVVGLSSGVVAVAAGEGHTCALTTAGGVKCWGGNGNGQLGDGTRTARPTPTDVVGLSSGVVAVAAGMGHTCALTSAIGVKCWGWNGSGQLGDGTWSQRLTPVDVVNAANLSPHPRLYARLG